MRLLVQAPDGGMRWAEVRTVRADYLHHDLHASLGLAVLYREPLAFHSREDRPWIAALPEDDSMLRALPDALPLDRVAEQLELARFAPPSTRDGERIAPGDLLVTDDGVYAGRVMRVLEVDAHCGNSSDILVTPARDPRANEDRIRVHGSFFRMHEAERAIPRT